MVVSREIVFTREEDTMVSPEEKEVDREEADVTAGIGGTGRTIVACGSIVAFGTTKVVIGLGVLEV